MVTDTASSMDRPVAELSPLETHAQQIVWLETSGDSAALATYIATLPDADVLEILEVVFETPLAHIWQSLSPERQQQLLPQLHAAVHAQIIAMAPPQEPVSLQKQILAAASKGLLDDVALLANDMPAAELADVLEAMPAPDRTQVWEVIPAERRSEVLVWLDETVRSHLLAKLDSGDVVSMVQDIPQDDLVSVVSTAPTDIAEAILNSMQQGDREGMEQRLAYAEHSAGRLMETDWVAVRADVSLGVVIRYLKFKGSLPAHSDSLLVVDREGRYQGKLPISALLTRPDDLKVAEVMQAHVDWVAVDAHKHQAADLFEQREVDSVAVVDAEHKLIGRLTMDTMMAVIRERAEAPMLQMAGLDEDNDLFAPILSSARERMFWLGLNLGTAFLAAWVIGLYEATLDKVVALAVLMPIVASMGGIAGSQTLTLAIRGLALGQISSANTRWLARKEIAIAGINGVVWAIVVGGLAWLWFGDVRISAVIGSALLINQFAAAVAGLAVPLILDKFGIDPALSGSVILTTVTDVVGFMSFLGLATWALL